ncbi:SpoIID/LytB domain-containing protein [Citricoccus sp. K5]|uniref:SpoIID/LytB domain-containing protein n=1 Tax=Citricoccus sp. K5 TaxID=2653135 RepID=UPI0012EFA6E2|nr:SpoIID/LytB domain-containing protein [Citricoccus sp. K5]VXA98708.1 SpoIID/LytB domain protein [Citricoccus sp. K5]
MPLVIATPPTHRAEPVRASPYASPGILRRTLAVVMALALTAVLTLSAAPVLAASTATATNTASFSDVPEDSTFYQPVMWMVRSGITTGRSGTSTFGVADHLNRAEASALLYRLMKPRFSPPSSSGFPDVEDTRNWDYAPITWMVSRKMVTGYADGEFKPLRHITRGELAKLLYMVADPVYSAPSGKPFTDVRRGDAYHPYISWLKHIGASHGYSSDGTFRPAQPITRGEASQLIRAVADVLGFDTSVVPADFTVKGAGWGHGVGMSQYGAAAMARGGSSVEQILHHYYSPAQRIWSSSRAAQNIRVHLLSTESTSIDGSGSVRVRTSGDAAVPQTAGAVQLTEQAGTVAVTMPDGTRTRGSSVVLEWTGTRFWSGQPSTVTVPRANGSSNDLVLRHGKLVVTVVNGKLNVVTELRMNDEYLYGLAEMPSSWPAAALQAQAVAGRAYALRNMGSLKAECACHVWDETQSQKFTGWAKEDEHTGSTHWGARWTAAVDATLRRDASRRPVTALSLWHNGSVADATYYSSSGGHTRNSGDVWSGTTVPYLTARPDPYSVSAAANNPNASWTQSVSQAALARAFGLKEIVAVRVTRGSDLSAQTVTASNKDGATRELTGTEFRSAVGTKSAWVFSVTPR